MREPLSQLASYRALRVHALASKSRTLRELFARDRRRFDTFSLQYEDVLFDYSKNRVTEETIDKLVSLFSECEVESWRDQMVAGKPVNSTENRAAQHVALRDLNYLTCTCATQQSDVLQRMQAFVDEIRASDFTDVVNLGIGGSQMGPMLVCDALSDDVGAGLNVHFVANLDATEIHRVLQKLNPASTLFIVTSKSFTTQETLANAEVAKHWLSDSQRSGNNHLAKHFVAISANLEKALSFGVLPERVFPTWDEIGGRFSLWSAVGLSIALYLGMPAFRELLQGANAMDKHFLTAPPRENMPVLLALSGIWNQHFLQASAHAVLPYDVRLRYMPVYLQQLEMESNGKFVDRAGNDLEVPSSPVVFGDVGTNAQHSFFQLLHQGTQTISCDFIGVVKASHANKQQHDMLLANMFGQTQALMQGQTVAEVKAQGAAQSLAPHKTLPGNRVSNTILLKQLTPRTLGMLLAMYEHKVFVQGIILNINSFDQMGVEFGKKLASALLEKMQAVEPALDQDSSTNALIDFYRQNSSPVQNIASSK